jgi:hypothetical protein
MPPSVLYISSIGTGLAKAAAFRRSKESCQIPEKIPKSGRKKFLQWTTTPARAKPQDAATDCKIPYVLSYTDSLNTVLTSY